MKNKLVKKGNTLTRRQKTLNEFPDLEINWAHPEHFNNVTHVALQTLYNELKEKGIIDPIKLFEGVEPGESLGEENKLVIEKIAAITSNL